MSVLKVLEIMSNSTESWEDATKNAVAHASKSVKGIKSAFVKSQSVVVEDNKVTEYRVNVKITFEVND
ncbi:MAG: dodecin family protein [Bacteroidota bacterium]